MKRKINKISMAVVATVMFSAALLLNVEQDRQGKLKLTTVSVFANMAGDGGDEDGEDCCSFWGGTCNQRVESIILTCTFSSQATVTYYSSSSKVTVVGMGIQMSPTNVQLTSGYKTAHYTITGGTTEPYPATKVNCPTDGQCNDCEPYFPC